LALRYDDTPRWVNPAETLTDVVRRAMLAQGLF